MAIPIPKRRDGFACCRENTQLDFVPEWNDKNSHRQYKAGGSMTVTTRQENERHPTSSTNIRSVLLKKANPLENKETIVCYRFPPDSYVHPTDTLVKSPTTQTGDRGQNERASDDTGTESWGVDSNDVVNTNKCITPKDCRMVGSKEEIAIDKGPETKCYKNRSHKCVGKYKVSQVVRNIDSCNFADDSKTTEPINFSSKPKDAAANSGPSSSRSAHKKFNPESNNDMPLVSLNQESYFHSLDSLSQQQSIRNSQPKTVLCSSFHSIEPINASSFSDPAQVVSGQRYGGLTKHSRIAKRTEMSPTIIIKPAGRNQQVCQIQGDPICESVADVVKHTLGQKSSTPNDDGQSSSSKFYDCQEKPQFSQTPRAKHSGYDEKRDTKNSIPHFSYKLVPCITKNRECIRRGKVCLTTTNLKNQVLNTSKKYQNKYSGKFHQRRMGYKPIFIKNFDSSSSDDVKSRTTKSTATSRKSPASTMRNSSNLKDNYTPNARPMAESRNMIAKEPSSRDKMLKCSAKYQLPHKGSFDYNVSNTAPARLEVQRNKFNIINSCLENSSSDIVISSDVNIEFLEGHDDMIIGITPPFFSHEGPSDDVTSCDHRCVSLRNHPLQEFVRDSDKGIIKHCIKKQYFSSHKQKSQKVDRSVHIKPKINRRYYSALETSSDSSVSFYSLATSNGLQSNAAGDKFNEICFQFSKVDDIHSFDNCEENSQYASDGHSPHKTTNNRENKTSKGDPSLKQKFEIPVKTRILTTAIKGAKFKTYKREVQEKNPKNVGIGKAIKQKVSPVSNDFHTLRDLSRPDIRTGQKFLRRKSEFTKPLCNTIEMCNESPCVYEDHQKQICGKDSKVDYHVNMLGAYTSPHNWEDDNPMVFFKRQKSPSFTETSAKQNTLTTPIVYKTNDFGPVFLQNTSTERASFQSQLSKYKEDNNENRRERNQNFSKNEVPLHEVVEMEMGMEKKDYRVSELAKKQKKYIDWSKARKFLPAHRKKKQNEADESAKEKITRLSQKGDGPKNAATAIEEDGKNDKKKPKEGKRSETAKANEEKEEDTGSELEGSFESDESGRDIKEGDRKLDAEMRRRSSTLGKQSPPLTKRRNDPEFYDRFLFVEDTDSETDKREENSGKLKRHSSVSYVRNSLRKSGKMTQTNGETTSHYYVKSLKDKGVESDEEKQTSNGGVRHNSVIFERKDAFKLDDMKQSSSTVGRGSFVGFVKNHRLESHEHKQTNKNNERNPSNESKGDNGHELDKIKQKSNRVSRLSAGGSIKDNARGSDKIKQTGREVVRHCSLTDESDEDFEKEKGRLNVDEDETGRQVTLEPEEKRQTSRETEKQSCLSRTRKKAGIEPLNTNNVTNRASSKRWTGYLVTGESPPETKKNGAVNEELQYSNIMYPNRPWKFEDQSRKSEPQLSYYPQNHSESQNGENCCWTLSNHSKGSTREIIVTKNERAVWEAARAYNSPQRKFVEDWDISRKKGINDVRNTAQWQESVAHFIRGKDITRWKNLRNPKLLNKKYVAMWEACRKSNLRNICNIVKWENGRKLNGMTLKDKAGRELLSSSRKRRKDIATDKWNISDPRNTNVESGNDLAKWKAARRSEFVSKKKKSPFKPVHFSDMAEGKNCNEKIESVNTCPTMVQGNDVEIVLGKNLPIDTFVASFLNCLDHAATNCKNRPCDSFTRQCNLCNHATLAQEGITIEPKNVSDCDVFGSKSYDQERADVDGIINPRHQGTCSGEKNRKTVSDLNRAMTCKKSDDICLKRCQNNLIITDTHTSVGDDLKQRDFLSWNQPDSCGGIRGKDSCNTLMNCCEETGKKEIRDVLAGCQKALESANQRRIKMTVHKPMEKYKNFPRKILSCDSFRFQENFQENLIDNNAKNDPKVFESQWPGRFKQRNSDSVTTSGDRTSQDVSNYTKSIDASIISIFSPCSFPTKGMLVNASIIFKSADNDDNDDGDYCENGETCAKQDGKKDKQIVELSFTNKDTCRTSVVHVHSQLSGAGAWPNVVARDGMIFVRFDEDANDCDNIGVANNNKDNNDNDDDNDDDATDDDDEDDDDDDDNDDDDSDDDDDDNDDDDDDDDDNDDNDEAQNKKDRYKKRVKKYKNDSNSGDKLIVSYGCDKKYYNNNKDRKMSNGMKEQGKDLVYLTAGSDDAKREKNKMKGIFKVKKENEYPNVENIEDIASETVSKKIDKRKHNHGLPADDCHKTEMTNQGFKKEYTGFILKHPKQNDHKKSTPKQTFCYPVPIVDKQDRCVKVGHQYIQIQFPNNINKKDRNKSDLCHRRVSVFTDATNGRFSPYSFGDDVQQLDNPKLNNFVGDVESSASHTYSSSGKIEKTCASSHATQTFLSECQQFSTQTNSTAYETRLAENILCEISTQTMPVLQCQDQKRNFSVLKRFNNSQAKTRQTGYDSHNTPTHKSSYAVFGHNDKNTVNLCEDNEERSRTSYTNAARKSTSCQTFCESPVLLCTLKKDDSGYNTPLNGEISHHVPCRSSDDNVVSDSGSGGCQDNDGWGNRNGFGAKFEISCDERSDIGRHDAQSDQIIESERQRTPPFCEFEESSPKRLPSRRMVFSDNKYVSNQARIKHVMGIDFSLQAAQRVRKMIRQHVSWFQTRTRGTKSADNFDKEPCDSECHWEKNGVSGGGVWDKDIVRKLKSRGRKIGNKLEITRTK